MNDLMNNFRICDKIDPELKKVTRSFYIFEDRNGYNVLFITTDDEVFSLGTNTSGVCGLGHEMFVDEPQVIEELCHKGVQHFYNGYNFVLALTKDNKIYGWGDNRWGQLAIELHNGSNETFRPHLIQDLKDREVKQISCGSAYTLILTADGVVYGWGDNTYGQIGSRRGLGSKVSVLRQLNGLPKIKSIHCSYCKSFAITSDGLVYSWGWNVYHYLGHQLRKSECLFTPKLIQNLKNIHSVCSSSNNTYFLTNDGNIYFCGKYLNENNIECFQTLPKLLESDSKFQSLDSRDSHLRGYPIGCALNHEFVCYLVLNRIVKTDYKTFEEFYSKRYQITYKTFDSQDL